MRADLHVSFEGASNWVAVEAAAEFFAENCICKHKRLDRFPTSLQPIGEPGKFLQRY